MEKRNFTESYINNLEVSDKRYFVSDAKYPYLKCLVNETGLKTYYFLKKWHNDTIKIRIERVEAITVEEARAIAHKHNNDLIGGKDPRSTKKNDQKITLLKVFEDLERISSWQPGTKRDYIYAMKNSFSDWRDKDIREINRDMIENRYNRLTKEKVSTPNLHFRFLRHLFNFAMEKYSIDGNPLIPSNPCNRLKTLKLWKKLPPREDSIPIEKLPEFFKATEIKEDDSRQTKQTKIQCRILLFTGCRDQEIASLKRKNIDLDKKVITLERTKNGKKHMVPFGDYLKEIFDYLCKGKEPDDFLFPAENKAGHLLYQAKSVRKIKAELSFKFYLHLCRHTFITYAISKLKIHGYLVKKLVNHISGMSGDVTFDYMGVDDESLREVVLKIEDFLLKNGTNCEKEASQI